MTGESCQLKGGWGGGIHGTSYRGLSSQVTISGRAGEGSYATLFVGDVRYCLRHAKGGHTLSSRHVSSCDVTRAVGM